MMYPTQCLCMCIYIIWCIIYICAMNDGRVLPKGRFLPYPPATRIWVTDVPNLWPIAGNQTELENHPDFSRSCPWFSPLKPINCPWCSPFWIPWRGPPAFGIFIPWSTAASWPFTSGTIRNPWNPSERFRGFWEHIQQIQVSKFVGDPKGSSISLCSSHPTLEMTLWDAMKNWGWSENFVAVLAVWLGSSSFHHFKCIVNNSW